MIKTCALKGIILLFIFLAVSCKKDPQPKDDLQANAKNKLQPYQEAIDSVSIASFFNKFPDFNDYRNEVVNLYDKHNHQYIWYQQGSLNEVADILYNRAGQIEAEGVTQKLPYEERFAELFSDVDKPGAENDLLISSMYFFYAKKVFVGINSKQSEELGWYLPRQKVSYVDYLDELLKEKRAKKEYGNISLYYNLKKGLQNYRDIRDKGGWDKIVSDGTLKLGDTGIAVVQLRKRLLVTGELSSQGSNVFDAELAQGVKAYQRKRGLNEDGIVTKNLITDLNVPVEDRIKIIMVNMERTRWLPPEITDSPEYVAVNIPSFRLRYIRDGKIALESNVVVGEEGKNTVVFSGDMTYLALSPYWNVPSSIIKKEIKPGMAKDKNYLAKHNMEWNGGNVRQKPGKNNSLGLVKFMFPNSNNIYLHDSPAKSIFGQNDRARSHGCVRVEKARDLAIMILDKEKNWTPAKVDAAMHAGKEKQYVLSRKIPVYIAYFTALADDKGDVSFYHDVYNRDEKLAELLYKN